MTEQEKQRVKERVAQLLDANDRIRIHELQSLRIDDDADRYHRLVPGAETYLVIAVGAETMNEQVAVMMLTSAVARKR